MPVMVKALGKSMQSISHIHVLCMFISAPIINSNNHKFNKAHTSFNLVTLYTSFN